MTAALRDELDAYLSSILAGHATGPSVQDVEPLLIAGEGLRYQVFAALGKPDRDGEAFADYFLSASPTHAFRFLFDAAGRLERSWFALRSQTAIEPARAPRREDLPTLRAGSSTLDELLRFFGPPQEELDFWPEHLWFYALADDRDTLEITARLGILTGARIISAPVTH